MHIKEPPNAFLQQQQRSAHIHTTARNQKQHNTNANTTATRACMQCRYAVVRRDEDGQTVVDRDETVTRR